MKSSISQLQLLLTNQMVENHLPAELIKVLVFTTTKSLRPEYIKYKDVGSLFAAMKLIC